jgi:pimeloyl-ACP methyl ester carboxylesterase
MNAPPPLEGVVHRQVVLGDVRLHVAEAGQGPPLVLLHGWPQHWWSWRRMIPALARTHRVLAVDLRGWGWSTAPPGRYAKRTFARDVLALLDAEGLERVRLMGHDWGGYTGFLLALEHPERLERLVALDIAPPWVQRPSPRNLALPLVGSYQVLLAAPVLGPRTMTSTSRFVETIIRAASGPDMRWTAEELDVYARVLREEPRARASSACYRTFLTHEAPAVLRGGDRSAELGVDTLLLMGGASPLHRALHPRPAARLRVETIPRAGHFLPEEAPDDVLERALPFLEGQAGT